MAALKEVPPYKQSQSPTSSLELYNSSRCLMTALEAPDTIKEAIQWLVS